MSEDIVAQIPVDLVLKLWPRIDELLKPVEEEGYYRTAHILAEAFQGNMQIWIAWDPERKYVDAVMVTQIYVYPLMKVCAVRWVRGESMKRWAKKFVEESEKFAKAMGCRRMGGGHRRGWKRIAGYREVGPLLVKDIE